MTDTEREEALRLARASGVWQDWMTNQLLDAVVELIRLARQIAPQQEPVDCGLDERSYTLVRKAEVEYAVSDGYERETLKAGTKVWLARWTDDQLEAARRSAEALHLKLNASPPAAPDVVRAQTLKEVSDLLQAWRDGEANFDVVEQVRNMAEDAGRLCIEREHGIDAAMQPAQEGK